MVVLLFVGGVLASLCLFLSIRGIFSERNLAVQATLVSSPVKAFAVGVAASLLVAGIFIGLQFSGVPPLMLISLVITALGLLMALFGLAAVVSVVGERVLALRNRDSSPFAQTAVGTLFLAGMGALPFLGWFVIAPIAALIGLGAFLMSIGRNRATVGTSA